MHHNARNVREVCDSCPQKRTYGIYIGASPDDCDVPCKKVLEWLTDHIENGGLALPDGYIEPSPSESSSAYMFYSYEEENIEYEKIEEVYDTHIHRL